MADLLLQPSIATDLRSQAHLSLISRLAQLDLSKILVYKLDTVDDSVIPWLAWQFDIQSPLWALLAPRNTSPQDLQRLLVETAVKLMSRLGTPSVMKQALAALGFPGITLLEGQNSWGGTFWPADQGWAVCRIQVPVPITLLVPPAVILPWMPNTLYLKGSFVSYLGFVFFAGQDVTINLPPIFDSVQQANSFGVDPGQIGSLTSINPLVPFPWFIFINGSIGYIDFPIWTAQISAVFEFFKPARCWLDEVQWLWAPQIDQVQIFDAGLFGSSIIFGTLAEQVRITDGTITTVFPAYSEPISSIPDFTGRWQYCGFDYSMQPRGITDSSTTVNGVPTEGNP